MVIITTKIDIKGKTPEEIYNWILNLDDDKYKKWHPRDHKEFKIIKRASDEIGSIVYFHEQFNSFVLKIKGELIKIKPSSLLVYKWKSFIPGYLFLSFETTKEGTLVTHTLKIGYVGMIGKITDWLMKKFYFAKHFEQALNRHAEEEFKNLEKIIQ